MTIHETAQEAAAAASRKVYDDAFAARAAETDAARAEVTRLTRLLEQSAGTISLTQGQLSAALAKVAELEALLPTPEAKPLLVDDFTDLDGWAIYHGDGSYAIQGARLRSNVELVDGTLVLHARPVEQAVTVGGTALAPGDYAGAGMILREPFMPGTAIELDTVVTASSGTRVACLLWPASEKWPEDGEFDVIEFGADIPDRLRTAITNHWGGTGTTPKERNRQAVRSYVHDFTRPCRIRVEWDHEFRVFVDGVLAATFTDHIPTWPMKLTLQTAVARGGKAATLDGKPRTPGRLEVTQRRVYALT